MLKPLIFVTNDDGVEAKGLKNLIETLKPIARIIAVAPEVGQSGMSHAITITKPLYLRKIEDTPDVKIYACSGTPVDCVKMAFDSLMLNQEMPSIVVSGINHGSNSAINILYSGTMGAAIEASFYNIPAIGFSLLDHDPDADFAPANRYIPQIVDKMLNSKIERPCCLNVNIPNIKPEDIKGVIVCRQNHGFWREEFEKREDPRGREYYWLTGYFHNTEKEATDTDEWALDNGYISIVPIQVDLTNYTQLAEMKEWKW